MSKTKFTAISANRCNVTTDGETTEYLAPAVGGFVRVFGGSNPQVHAASGRGATLVWNPKTHPALVDLMRSEHRKRAREERAWLKAA